MTTTDWPAFLAARLDELEALARATAPAPWTWESGRHGSVVADLNGETVADPGYRWSDRTHLDNVKHIVAHDPAYVLADIAAKRAILKRYREREDAFVSRTSLTEPDQRIEGMLGMRLNGHLEDIKDLCRPFAGHDDWPGE